MNLWKDFLLVVATSPLAAWLGLHVSTILWNLK